MSAEFKVKLIIVSVDIQRVGSFFRVGFRIQNEVKCFYLIATVQENQIIQIKCCQAAWNCCKEDEEVPASCVECRRCSSGCLRQSDSAISDRECCNNKTEQLKQHL